MATFEKMTREEDLKHWEQIANLIRAAVATCEVDDAGKTMVQDYVDHNEFGSASETLVD
jgi:hypothetical protein